ncbi:hypothetical protein AcV7_000253 [Taiwanofungus camphoratus]|nr:hypothetical protein AcV7_000253 [Antrodia cinnamomea]
MYLRVPLLVFLLANIMPADANVFQRGSRSLVRAVNSAHHKAVKRSTGFLNDLRVAYGGLLVQQPGDAGKMYCVSGPSSGTSPTGVGHGTNGTSATSPEASGTSSASAPVASGGSTASSPWKLTQNYEGSSFFNGWSFFTYADPTGGDVAYVDQGTAQSANLTSINSAGNAIMRVDTTPTVSGNRQSVRITTDYTYTGGLVIMDSVHMPTGCGTWPAFWSNGPNWPAGGEIDIVEGVNDYTNNQVTLHTNSGCTLPSTNTTALAITGTVIEGTDCSVAGTGDQGCGIRAAQANSFGAAFNAIGGGVYAMQWVDSGISVFFFQRSAVPADITAGAPQPAGWGTPIASFPASSCNPSQFFYNQSVIFDTTLCGAWAGDAWDAAGAPGQAQSCAQRTGAATCQQFVQNNGSAFADAYWEVKSVKIYQLRS